MGGCEGVAAGGEPEGREELVEDESLRRERMETRIGRMSREGREMLAVDVTGACPGVGVVLGLGERAAWDGDAIVDESLRNVVVGEAELDVLVGFFGRIELRAQPTMPLSCKSYRTPYRKRPQVYSSGAASSTATPQPRNKRSRFHHIEPTWSADYSSFCSS